MTHSFRSIRPRRAHRVFAALGALTLLLFAGRPADAQEIVKGSLVAGPLGLAAGQTMRLNVLLPGNAKVATTFVTLRMIDGLTGELLASKDVTIARGKGAFLDYTDPALPTGGRRCILAAIGVPQYRKALSATVQTYDQAGGQTVVAMPLLPVGTKPGGAGPGILGLASGQTMRLNAWLPPTARVASANVRFVLLDANTGEFVATKVATITRGGGDYLDYADSALAPGQRRCLVGILVSGDGSSAAKSVTGVTQVYDTATGRTREWVNSVWQDDWLSPV